MQGVKLKKSLGQHFLVDVHAQKHIVELLHVEDGDQVLEIGPGGGAITSHLRLLPWKKLLLLEKDSHWAQQHRQQSAKAQTSGQIPSQSEIQVWEGDALTFVWQDLVGPWKMAGNLPYNVASPLMWDMLSQIPNWVRAVFMVQKEVGLRVLAQPSTKEYGALSVWLQSYAQVQKGFYLGPGAFSPPPKVDSAVVVFTPKDQLPSQPQALARLIKMCFQQRRKQLQSILKGLPTYQPEIWGQVQIDAKDRPENLSPEQFQNLASILFPQS